MAYPYDDPAAATRSVARKRYAALVTGGVAYTSPCSVLNGQALFSRKTFIIRQMAPCLQKMISVREVTRWQRLLQCSTLKQVFADTKTKTLRNVAMERAYREYGYAQAEIAHALDMPVSVALKHAVDPRFGL